MIRAALILVIAGLALSLMGDRLASTTGTRDGVAALLTETNPPPGFAYALEPRRFHFPRDHGAHTDFRSEWWYFTGNLDGAQRAFGFQLTVFRFALRPGNAGAASPWRSNHVYLGHFALSDFDADTFHSAERRARPALDLAGADAAPPTIWVNDWRIEQLDAEQETWRLRASAGDVAIDLNLRAMRAIVPQGERGLSRKSTTPGNASYYYSIPRLDVTGAVSLNEARHDVAGDAWFDHEWSTSALAENQVGWDWFALQLDDGRDVMFYQIRDRAGRPDRASHGVIMNPDGTTVALGPEEIELRVTDYWRSRASGARYPSAWRIRIPAVRLALTVRPRIANQEWHKNFTYWEGAVGATGHAGDNPITARGYVELVGYD